MGTHRGLLIAATAVAVLASAACGNAGTSTGQAVPTTAVAETDQNLRVAAQVVNSGIVGDTVTFDQTIVRERTPHE